MIHSIYLVHDDAKEKEFELEMSWIGDETGGLHLPVPKALHDEAGGSSDEEVVSTGMTTEQTTSVNGAASDHTRYGDRGIFVVSMIESSLVIQLVCRMQFQGCPRVHKNGLRGLRG